MDSAPTSTRDRIVREAMRLFGRQGYAGTSVAAIEAAAGLSAGSGGLYKHFGSKREILVEGVSRLIEAGSELSTLLGQGTESEAPVEATEPTEPGGPAEPRAAFERIARAGLRRLEHEADFNRVLVRDLAAFPDLLARARDDEIARNHRALTAWLEAQSPQFGATRDWSAMAAVLIGATSHYWLLRDIFGGEHPTGVSEDDYVAALADLAAGLLARQPEY